MTSVQGYLELDYQEMDDETFEQFNIALKQFMIQYYRVHKASREYYHCILRAASVIDSLVSSFSARNPIINGVWNIDGTVYDSALYTFDLDIHLSHQPDIITYNDDGEVESTTAPTEFNAMHQFGGWAICTPY